MTDRSVRESSQEDAAILPTDLSNTRARKWSKAESQKLIASLGDLLQRCFSLFEACFMTVQPNFNPKLPRRLKQNRLRFIIAISLLALLGVEERKRGSNGDAEAIVTACSLFASNNSEKRNKERECALRVQEPAPEHAIRHQ